MILFDAKKLWIEGGYGLDNPYEIFIARVRAEARSQQLPQDELELILVDFFLELREDPMKYRTEGNKCEQCPCTITNSGTNATHYIFNQIKNKKDGLVLAEQDRFTLAMNNKIEKYIKKDNEAYIEENAKTGVRWKEGKLVPLHWTDVYIPTFKRWYLKVF